MSTRDSSNLKNRYFNKTALKAFLAVNSTIIITVVVVLLVLWVFIPQLSNLKESIQAVEQANKVLLVWAIFVFCMGFPILAYKYCLLVPQKIAYWLTFQVQIASAFISKLLPMSIGSLTVNTYYLTKATKSVAIAGSTMALNAMTSSVAFGLIIVVALLGNHGAVSSHAKQPHDIRWPLIAFIILGIGFVCWWLIHSDKFLRRLKKAANDLWQNFKAYKNTPYKVIGGIGLNGLGSLTGITALYLCCHSVGLNVTYAEAILTYTLGNIVGSLVPTPGGLGGAEAGLYGGLVFFGYTADTALIAVLIYRLISYWLPIIPGYLMFRHLRRTALADFHLRSKKQS